MRDLIRRARNLRRRLAKRALITLEAFDCLIGDHTWRVIEPHDNDLDRVAELWQRETVHANHVNSDHHPRVCDRCGLVDDRMTAFIEGHEREQALSQRAEVIYKRFKEY